MADKMTCPGCDSHTSGILRAYEDGQPCPVCGLSAQATDELLAARRRRADEITTQKLEEAIKRADKLERENATLQFRLAEVERAVTQALKAEPMGNVW